MIRIVWLPSMSVGIEKWDSDHRVLLELINRVDGAMRQRSANPDTIGEAFDMLVQYSEVHFRAEEEAMARLSYPRRDEHRAEHDKMRAWIAEKSRHAAPDDPEGLTREVAEHLVHWLYTHVLTIDMQYTEFFDERRRQLDAVLGDYRELKLAD